MTLPAALSYGTVKWRVALAIPDTLDADATPNAAPVAGSVTFTPSAKHLLVGGETPTTVYLSPLVYFFDAAGVLRDVDGRELLELPATNAAGVSPTGWTYRVDARIGGSLLSSFSFALPAGSTVDLTTVAPVPAANGTPITRGEKGEPGAPGIGDVTDPAVQAALSRRAVRPPTAQLSQPGLVPTVRTHSPEATQEISAATIYAVTPLDETNLAVTFVVPPSGEVLVTLQASYRTSTAAGNLTWWLLDAAGIIPGAYVPVGAGQTANAVAVRTIRVTNDSAGQKLVPGRTVTLRWAHQSGHADPSLTVFGGGGGPAIMRVEPVSHRLTERQVTATERATNTYVPLWLSHDRTTLLGYSFTTGKLSWSADDGVTWSENPQTLPGVGLIRHLDNGELAVFCGQGDAGTVWISTGWSADKTTATFSKTLDFAGSPPESVYGAHPAPWGVDAYGPIVLAAEYGPKNGPADMARYCYLSEDYGQTWRVIFDLAEKRPGNGSADAHLHGVCYDPWWDAIWLTQGDNAQRGTWVSYDRGATWLEIPVNGGQFTTVVPMPECVLLVSDIDPDGIYRIPRTAKDAPYIERALPVGGAGLDLIGFGWFRARDLPDAPLLLAAYGANGQPGRVWATHDGYSFREVWTDTVGYQDRGAQIAVGPTVDGTYHVHLIVDDEGGPVRKHLVLTPA